MQFNITNLDKVVLIQTLYAHADPKGYGELTYKIKNDQGFNVSGLSKEECIEILSKQDKSITHNQIVDYYNGKPIKLNFFHKNNGETYASSSSYDIRNGKYRFLEALLNAYSLDEILISQKGYGHMKEMVDGQNQRPKEQTKIFDALVKGLVKHQDNLGTYWKIGTNEYVPFFMK